MRHRLIPAALILAALVGACAGADNAKRGPLPTAPALTCYADDGTVLPDSTCRGPGPYPGGN